MHNTHTHIYTLLLYSNLICTYLCVVNDCTKFIIIYWILCHKYLRHVQWFNSLTKPIQISTIQIDCHLWYQACDKATGRGPQQPLPGSYIGCNSNCCQRKQQKWKKAHQWLTRRIQPEKLMISQFRMITFSRPDGICFFFLSTVCVFWVGW